MPRSIQSDKEKLTVGRESYSILTKEWAIFVAEISMIYTEDSYFFCSETSYGSALKF